MDTALQISIAVLFVMISGYIIINGYVKKREIHSNGKRIEMNNYDCKLIVDLDQKLFYQWLMTDTKQNVSWATGDMFGYPVDLKKLQNAPINMYPQRFPSIDDIEHSWSFRSGKLLNVDRFILALLPKKQNNMIKPIIFGYVECLFIDSYKLNGKIGWLYCVYIAPNFRQNGLGTMLINKCLQYFHSKQIKDVHLCVEDDNIAAQALYKKCKFKQYRTNYHIENGHNQTYLVMKHSVS